MQHQNQSRRAFLRAAGLGLVSLPLILEACSSLKTSRNGNSFMVYVGTYADAADESIFGYRLHAATGELSRVLAVRGGANPSFLTLDTRRHFLYAVNERGDFNGSNTGAVSAFAVNQQSGDLTLLSQHATLGAAPCYVSADQTHQFLFVANYGGGNVTVFPIQTTGEVGPARDMDQHIGKGPHKNQKSAHAHCFLPDPSGEFFFSVDLGIDQVTGYRLNRKTGKLTRSADPAFATKPGAGPRILTFHPNGVYAYLICELSSTMYALAYDRETGTFKELEQVSTLPDDFTGESFCAHVAVSPNGKFLYGSNRGHNSLVVYAIGDSGKLSLVEHVDVVGKWPRHFSFDPTGTWLLVANQHTSNITTFRVNPDMGRLTYTGYSAEVPAPVCVQVVKDFV